MTDLFRGYDLTTVADKVAESQWMKRREEALSRGFEAEKIPPWHELEPLAKLNFKSSLLPVITDVLDALESDQVKPTEAKKMVPYGFNEGDRSDPRWYENQLPTQHDTATATVWTLHINVHPSAKDAMLERASVLPETTGEFIYGDSWREWGEETDDDTNRHLGIYFDATPARAFQVAEHLCNHLVMAAVKAAGAQGGSMPEWHVSTAGDWAEQVRE